MKFQTIFKLSGDPRGEGQNPKRYCMTPIFTIRVQSMEKKMKR
jgi:hypothetical protein